jgi:hypothetical protein
VATLEKKDSIYCIFEDDENFVEYYDHLRDPWQLHNRASELCEYEHDQFKARISELRSCKGVNNVWVKMLRIRIKIKAKS